MDVATFILFRQKKKQFNMCINVMFLSRKATTLKKTFINILINIHF